jgi:RNA polymerase sigma factor (TIGR02999 family)
MTSAGEVTELLRRWGEGERASMDPLFNLVYPRLRQIAGSLFRRESAASLLQPTGVVNELFLKLVSQRTLQFESREHFFSFAASLMRRILVDQARAARSDKRDGGVRVALDDDLVWIATMPSVDVLDIDRALGELEKIDPRKSHLVELRFFLGTTAEEAAEILHTSKATVDRELRFARGWLYDRLRTTDGLAGAPLDPR